MTLEQINGHNFPNNDLIYNPLELSELSQCSLFIAVDSHDMSSDYKVPI